MQIECPSCGAAYEVPDHIMARKRVMRCARCTRDWAPVPSPDRAQEAFEPPPAPVAVPMTPRQESAAAARPSVSAGRKAAILGAWAASVAVLGLAGWLSAASEKRIVQAWPPSARLYAALGLRK